jgi:2-dehydro-3-deoxygalactonokinase
MSRLLAIDWGSSSLRGALLDDEGRVLDARSSARGMLSLAKEAFAGEFERTFGDWMDAEPTACLIAGMAGSRQGWVEAPYCPCPAGLQELAAALAPIPDFESRGWSIAVVPGLSCTSQGVPDVLRGEETQILGALRLLGVQDALVVLPGTHSKWATVRDGRVVGFETFMSGEFYALLRQHSILVHSVAAAEIEPDWAAFDAGVDRAREAASLLRSAFSVRALSIFGVHSPEASLSYLSGLVIGEELRCQAVPTDRPVVVVGAPALTDRYEHALSRSGVSVTTLDASASWSGLRAIHDHRLEIGASHGHH